MQSLQLVPDPSALFPSLADVGQRPHHDPLGNHQPAPDRRHRHQRHLRGNLQRHRDHPGVFGHPRIGHHQLQRRQRMQRRHAAAERRRSVAYRLQAVL